jgi:endonuclease YncB( thermonuclease family)
MELFGQCFLPQTENLEISNTTFEYLKKGKRSVRNCSKINLSVILLLLFLPTFSLAGEFKGTRVYDGDTIKAEGHDIEIKVRLVGIDAPETSRKKREPGQSFSYQAKRRTWSQGDKYISPKE